MCEKSVWDIFFVIIKHLFVFLLYICKIFWDKVLTFLNVENSEYFRNEKNRRIFKINETTKD